MTLSLDLGISSQLKREHLHTFIDTLIEQSVLYMYNKCNNKTR